MNEAQTDQQYDLKDFGVLSSLSRDNLERVREAIHPFEVPVGAVLQANLEQGWLIYLIEGPLTVINEKGERVQKFDGSSDRAMDPVFAKGCSDLQVQATQDASLIRIDRLDVEVLLSRQLAEATEVSEVSFEECEAQIFACLLEAHEAGELQVPSLPEVAAKVNQAVSENDMDFNRLAAVIKLDPPYTARLIQMANSAAYRSGAEIGTLSGAISRLGLDGTRNLVMAIAVEQLANGVHPAALQSFRNYYQEAGEVASLCCVLAQKTESLCEERAYMAGLLHGLGMVPIINHGCELLSPDPDIGAIELVGERLVEPVSSWLLSGWGLDDELCDTAEYASEWYRPVGDTVGLVEIVIAARLLRFVARSAVAPADIATTDIGKRLIDLGVELQDPLEFLNKNEEQIESARHLLG